MIITDNKTLEAMYLDVTGEELVPVDILADYREYGASGAIDLGTFSAEETAALMEAGIADVTAKTDGWNNPALLELPQPGACSCCIKKLADGTVVMGRNMDLPISFSPVILYRTTGNGKDTYDTFNMTYTAPGPITFDQVAELGAVPKSLISGWFASSSDTMNSEGLYLELNLRIGTDCPTESTNPGAKLRTACITIARLVGDHCATIEEALAYLETIDVFDPKCVALDWSMALALMDKTGRYGCVEFTNNKIIWNEGRPGFACGQGNFYWNEEGIRESKINIGLGRWHKLMEYYNGIKTNEDMEHAMQKIWYSNLFTDGSVAKDWQVDWMSDMKESNVNAVTNKWLKLILDWKEQYGIEYDEEEFALAKEVAERQERDNIIWDDAYNDHPMSYYDVFTVMDLFTKCFVQTPLDVQKASGLMEASTISYVADTKNVGMKLRFFEMNDIFYIGIHETTIERHPSTKKFGPHETGDR